MIKFKPANDNILVRMDRKVESAIEVGVRASGPPLLPSGLVVDVGLGIMLPGLGFAGSKFQKGDHVALDMGMVGQLKRLPLDDSKDVYTVVPEASVIGVLVDCDEDSSWFRMGQPDSPIILPH